jgi:hypothetical protein
MNGSNIRLLLILGFLYYGSATGQNLGIQKANLILWEGFYKDAESILALPFTIERAIIVFIEMNKNLFPTLLFPLFRMRHLYWVM